MGRTIIVGDVHGCADELDALFDRLALASDDDVVFVGDLIVRGPKPLEVIDIVRGVGARSIRGNHEHRLMQWRDRIKRSKRGDRGAVGTKGPRATAEQLRPQDWDFIDALPLWLELPEHDLLVVHAGVVPGIALEDQDERNLMFMRCITADGQPSEHRDGGTCWGKLYRGGPHVAFGHYAMHEPQLHEDATGLDTGCVYGGRLTALVLDRGGAVPAVEDRRDALVSVKARRVYIPI